MIEIRLLGPFAVERLGKPVNLGGRQRRTLLAVLAVYSDNAVSTDKLIDELWGQDPPSSARKTVQAHISHLRRALNTESELLVSEDEGYVLRVEPETVDSHRFEMLLENAGEIRDADPGEALLELNRAIGLFRGAPLAGIADNAFSLRVEASRLEALRLAALEDRLEVLLRLGDPEVAATDAERLLAEHPLRERLWSILMLALYRSDRQAEALQAFSRARQILVQELGLDPSPALQALEQRILEHDPGLAIDSIATAEPPGTPVVRNPFKGLRSFDESDASDFFGREDLIRKLEERTSSRQAPRLLLLAGPSGAGKSSAVRAGLIPRLRDMGRNVAVMFPGSSPLDALVTAIAAEVDEEVHEVPSDVLEGRGPGDDLVVVVDQLEELFTAGADDGALHKFLSLLAHPPIGIDWVATVRADFIGRLLSSPQLGGLVSDCTILVPPLQEHEVRAALESPARRVGLEVEPDLTAAVVRDVSAQPASLPLLQYALTDLFDRSDKRTLRLTDYRAAGGISGALVRRADEIYESLDEKQRRLARCLFLELVSVTEDGNEVRRRLQRSALVEEFGAFIEDVIDRFGEVRLLTFDQDPDSGEPTVEIAHESLVAAWPMLDRWVGEAAEDLQIRRRLIHAAAEWESAERHPDYLLSGSRLLTFTSWEKETDLRLTGAAKDYLNTSTEHQRVQERRSSRIRRVVVGSITATALIALILAVIAFDQRQEAQLEAERANEQAQLAEEQQRNAEMAARRAEVRRLAARSVGLAASDPEGALIDALEAIEISRRDGELPVLKEAQEALRLAVQSIRTALDLDAEGVAQFNASGDEIVVGSGEAVAIWSTDTGELDRSLTGPSGLITAAGFVGSRDLVVANNADGTTTIWDAISGGELQSLDVGQVPDDLAVSPTGGMIAISYPGEDISVRGQVRVWDTRTWELIFARTAPNTRGVAFSDDGSLVAAATSQGVTVWSTATGDLAASIPYPPTAIFYSDVAFAGDQILVSISDTVRSYDMTSGSETGRFFGPHSDITKIGVFEGSLVAAGTLSGEVVVWEIDSGRPLAVLRGQGSEILDVDFHPSGEKVAAATNDSVRVWDFTPEGSYEWYTIAADPPVAQTDASADGTLMVSVNYDLEHSVGVWEADTGTHVRWLVGHAQPVFQARFGPGGQLGTASFDGTARIWDAATGVETDVFSGGLGPVSSLSFSGDGSRFGYSYGPGGFCSASAGFVDIEDIAESDLVFSRQVSSSTVYDVRLSPDGSWFAASSCGVLTVWDIASGTPKWEVEVGEEPNTPTMSIDVSPDGSQIATGGFDGVVRVWDSSDGQLRRTFEGHGAQVTSLEFSSDGVLLVSGSDDGTSRIWNVNGGYEEVMIGGHQTGVADVTLTPDGKRLITTGGVDGTVRVHALDIDDLVDLAHEKLERFSNLVHLD